MDKPFNQGTDAQQGIPDAGLSEFEKSAQGFIRPYFDPDGTVTSMDITPGSPFDVWVFAEFNDAFVMSGAEYKLLLPEGVSILSSAQSDSVIVTLGKPEVDFMVAFHCLDGPKHWLMKYICKADDDFQGGVIKTVQGDNLKFLGFVTCDVSKTEVRATGGWVKLGVQ